MISISRKGSRVAALMERTASDACSSFQPHAQPTRSLLECGFASLEDVANCLPNLCVLEAAGSIRNWWQSAVWMRPSFGNDDLIRIGVDHEIRIVRDYDHLAVLLGLDEKVHQLVEDRLGIEILLWLVDHERPVVAVV